MNLDTIYEKIVEKIDNIRVLRNEPMSKHTSFKTGGNADIFVKVMNIDEIKYLLDISKKYNSKITIIGNGTNILVKDNGIRGIVVKVNLLNCNIKKDEEKLTIVVGSGVSLAKVSRLAEENSASGLEFAVGIPGSIGGAVYMNAGAYGSEMKNVVVSTKYMDYQGNIKELTNEEQKFEYRSSIFSNIDGIILQTKIELPIGNRNEIHDMMEKNRNSRIEKQPLDKPNAGSTFKRGNGFITAQLIDKCGLKGYKIGGAIVSNKHAGFIVNQENASTKDILDLIEYVKEKVYEKYKVKIELEIQVLGE